MSKDDATTPETPMVPTLTASEKKRTIGVHVKPGETIEQAMAELVVRGTARNASTIIQFSEFEYSDLSLMDMARSLRAQGDAVNAGDLSAAERLLNAQAASLNAIFNELARRAALNMGEHLHASETYMRLALKSQAQCRATVETLADIKAPRAVAFVQQANIANGPQQVNNGTQGLASELRAGESEKSTNELLEESRGERLVG
jgi:hypothetical protein